MIDKPECRHCPFFHRPPHVVTSLDQPGDCRHGPPEVLALPGPNGQVGFMMYYRQTPPSSFCSHHPMMKEYIENTWAPDEAVRIQAEQKANFSIIQH